MLLTGFVGCGETTIQNRPLPAPPKEKNTLSSPAPAKVEKPNFIELGESVLVINDASDTSRRNVIKPINVDGIKTLTQTFTFNSVENSLFYFDPEWKFGSCQGKLPMPVFHIEDGRTRQRVRPQSLIEVKPDTDYRITFRLTDLNCSDWGFYAEFGFRGIE